LFAVNLSSLSNIGLGMFLRLIALCLALLCAACSAQHEDPATMGQSAPAQDPLEGYNRSMMKLNGGLTKFIIRPVVTVYRAVFPQPLRKAVANVSSNAKAPLIFAHDVLQAEPDRAFQTLGRFMMNSTVGVGGLFDPASQAGVPLHDEDAGQTFGRWGVPAGPYVMLPVLGPSNVRDSLGYVADFFGDPLGYVVSNPPAPSGVGTGFTVGSGLSLLDQNIDLLAELERGSVDPYVALREAYRQSRQAAIKNGAADKPKPEDDPLADVLDAPQ
jgi:phospholipid-binding lipoprotein MlaA